MTRSESRETINPRPTQYGHIAALHLSQLGPTGVGFSSYSEGANDDLNKFIWSAVAWGGDKIGVPADVAAPRLAPNSTELRLIVERTVVEYANLLISSTHAADLSTIIFGLEAAWVGPLATNPHVHATLATVRWLQQQSTQGPSVRRSMASNWRWQQLQYRAM